MPTDLPDTAQCYFAFGANLNPKVFIDQRNMKPIKAVPAVLTDYRLVFNEKGYPPLEPAFASVIPSQGHEVWGIAYTLMQEDFDRLHKSEGNDYKAMPVQVRAHHHECLPGFTYITQNPTPKLKPSKRYLHLIIEGAIHHKLPAHYIQMLSRKPHVYIPLLSELAGWLITAGIKHLSKASTFNLNRFRSGAKPPES